MSSEFFGASHFNTNNVGKRKTTLAASISMRIGYRRLHRSSAQRWPELTASSEHAVAAASCSCASTVRSRTSSTYQSRTDSGLRRGIWICSYLRTTILERIWRRRRSLRCRVTSEGLDLFVFNRSACLFLRSSYTGATRVQHNIVIDCCAPEH